MIKHSGRDSARAAAVTAPEAPWSLPFEQLLTTLRTSVDGLDSTEAQLRLRLAGPNSITTGQRTSPARLLLGQFRSPLVLILIAASVVSGILGEWTNTAVVLGIVLISTMLGFVQEYRASNAVEQLRSRLALRTTVLRDGRLESVPSEQLVPGDVVQLSAGSLVPADGVILSADDFFVNQAVLTGETFPVEKQPGKVSVAASLAERTNSVFMGTTASGGSAHVLIVQTGRSTVYGQVAQRLTLRPPQTEFERGLNRLGNLFTQVMLLMVIFVLAVNVFLARPLVDSLLFSVALAVGLTPELLPAIVTITLSQGAQHLAKHRVIVRRLNSIENLGSMDVLCTDKTGTLTEGVVRLDGALGATGKPEGEVLRLAYFNASLQTGLDNPMDAAIIAYVQSAGIDIKVDQKVDEIPFDFVRKRLSVIVADAEGVRTLITKGALESVLARCTTVRAAGEVRVLDTANRLAIEKLHSDWSTDGFRVLGVAAKPIEAGPTNYPVDAESDLTFAGFLLFFDPPKPDVQQIIVGLARRGIQLKIITGDNRGVAQHIAQAVSLPVEGVLTGSQLNSLPDEALWHLAERTTIFAEVDPNQKERIILALRKTGHVVGYLGDGINDAPALYAADVGISVDSAVDVAKEAADFVLLASDLAILCEGVDEGRRTFANTLKYVLTTSSANVGNMLSMAGASLFLPFLPLLAPQILLNNFLSDIPAASIANDNVDHEWIEHPRRWNTSFIRRYMVLFGLVSSIFDFLTFAILLRVFHASPEEFRTVWFIESLLSELVIALVVRTRHLFCRSRPGRMLLRTTLILACFALLVPYLPFMSVFGFIPVPASLMAAVVGLTASYVLVAELTKKFFYSRLAPSGE